jgi:plasmid stability protein
VAAGPAAGGADTAPRDEPGGGVEECVEDEAGPDGAEGEGSDSGNVNKCGEPFDARRFMGQVNAAANGEVDPAGVRAIESHAVPRGEGGPTCGVLAADCGKELGLNANGFDIAPSGPPRTVVETC